MFQLSAVFWPLVAIEGAEFLSSPLVPVLAILGIFYFLVLRPMSKQDKNRRQRLSALKKGDQVVLGGGMLGRISNFEDPKIAVVEIADKVKVRVLKKDIVDTQASALQDDVKAKSGSPAAAVSKAKEDKAKDTDRKSA